MITLANGIVRTGELEMLQLLLNEDQFEIAEPESLKEKYDSGKEQSDGQDPEIPIRPKKEQLGQQRGEIRIVYLMNDAVESFLVFENALLTGIYDPDYEGPLTSYLDRKDSQYILVVYQGENVLTIFFDEIRKEISLYNYARLGHFWVKGYEYLRQMEYHLAILRDKRDYLGEEYCNAEELELAVLTEFPPLNYCCYPAAPDPYIVPSYPRWKVSKAALREIGSLAREAGDRSMQIALRIYSFLPCRWFGMYISVMFHRKKHAKVTDLLIHRIASASAGYANRNFTDEKAIPGGEPELRNIILEKAEYRIAELKMQNRKADLIWEEPFTVSRDSIEMKAYLMIWEEDGRDRRVRIEIIT